MPECASVFQTVQLGVEVTPGTPVNATTKLQSVSITPTPKAEIEDMTAAGQKYATLTFLGKEFSEFAIGGKPTFDEIHYLTNSVIAKVSPTTPGTPAAALARDWTMTSAQSAADTVQTYTVEQGSTLRAQRFGHFLVTDIGLVFTRDTVDLSGSAIGQAIAEPFSFTTGGVTSKPLIPVLPKQVDVYLDDTSAGLGTTKLLRCMRAEWRIGGRFGPIWPLNSANFSWETYVETKPEISVVLRLAADAQGMGMLTTMRQGARKFMRIVANGGFIDALPTIAITSSTNATPPVFTTATHNLIVGDVVVIAGHSVTSYNGTWRTATAPTGTSATFNDYFTGQPMQANGAGTGGTLAEQVNPYRLKIDQAVEVKEIGGYQDEQGLYCIDWNMIGVHDTTWGKSHELIVTNKQSTIS